MKSKSFLMPLFGSVLLASFVAAMPVQARPDEQADARAHMKAGQVMSLRDIEARVVPRMGGMEYLGPEYDSRSQVYRLKFIDNGRVYFVDVDARTGAILSTK